METFLRLKKIPYEAKSSLSKWSKYGKMPFVEFNGEHLADSAIIIKELTKRLHLPDENLSTEEQGHLHAVAMMVENNTLWSFVYYRYVDAVDEIYKKEFTFVPGIYKAIMTKIHPWLMKGRAEKHGIGCHTKEEIYDFGFQDLQALSNILGEKPFFAGKEMTTVDCTIFGHLAQIVFIPIGYPHLLYMQQNCPNLLQYVERVKNLIWSDWDEKCAQRK